MPGVKLGRLVLKPDLNLGEVPPHLSILQILLERRIGVLHSCRRGLCGQDMIRVLRGADQLNEVSENENDTLCMFGARAEPIRLACCTRVIGAGEVEIEIVK